METMKLLGKSWKYINEGNAHIVIEIVDTNYVLRLIKEDEKPVHKEHIMQSVTFVNFIMVPLSDNYSYGTAETVEIPDSNLTELLKELKAYRQKKRLIKSTLSPFAIKVANLSIVSHKCKLSYCVEIKPKEGFLSSSLKVHSKCYYCLKQFMKLHNNDITEASLYCPLDLFSGNRKRMKLSLKSMIRNPQNNLKVFRNGMFLTYDESLQLEAHELQNIILFSNTDLLIDFIIEVLLSEKGVSTHTVKESAKNSQEIPTIPNVKSCNESNNLKPNNILYNLLQLQKLSETVTIDEKAIVDQHYEYVSQILDDLKSRNLNLNIPKDREIFFKTANPTHLALISAIAKDCSIMISFSTDLVESMPYVDVEHLDGKKSRVYYKLALTDLEPKSMATLLKRKYTEKKMIEIYENHVQSLHEELNYSNLTNCTTDDAPTQTLALLEGIQPHSETRAKQLEAWQTLITDYLKTTKQSTIDIREAQNSPLFNNTAIKRKLSQESVLTVLEDMAKTGRAVPVDKSKNVWEIYWHSLDEWGNMVYAWACNNGMNNSVCTLFELREGDNTADQEFHGLDMSVLVKALKTLELKGRCELMEFDDSQGVKFF